MRAVAILCVLAASLIAGAVGAASAGAALPPIKHVWIIVLENKSFDTTFGASPGSTYLANTLPSQGELLRQYYGIGHSSLDNYIAMISGQPPTSQTKADCGTYSDFAYDPGMGPPLPPDGVAHGTGCVYPTEVQTIGDQLEGKSLTWKQYAEDETNTLGEPNSCRHPAIGANDTNEGAKPTDQFATKHVPFLYFHSIIDRPICATNVIDLTALQTDLASASTTPSYSFISPDLCSDGHDANCADGGPGGFTGITNFLQTWVPRITGSPAYADGGLLIIDFDEAAGDATDCCGEPQGGNPPSATFNGSTGNGGGRTGAVLLSNYIKPGTVNDTPYNHYSMLRSVEDLFSLPHLANAGAAGLAPFGDDVFTQPPAGPKPQVTVTHVPGTCGKSSFSALVQVVSKRLRDVRVFVDGKKVATSKRHKLSVRIVRKKLKRGKHSLRAQARDLSGRSGRKTVSFRVCR